MEILSVGTASAQNVQGCLPSDTKFEEKTIVNQSKVVFFDNSKDALKNFKKIDKICKSKKFRRSILKNYCRSQISMTFKRPPYFGF